MLLGACPPPLPRVKTLSLVSTHEYHAAAFTMPTVQTGDLVVLFDTVASNGNGAGAPAGFTPIYDSRSDLKISARIAQPGDTGATFTGIGITTGTAASLLTKLLIILRGNRRHRRFTVHNLVDSGARAVLAPPPIVVSAAGVRAAAIAFGLMGTNGSSPGSSVTMDGSPNIDRDSPSSNGGWDQLHVKGKTYNYGSAPANHNVSGIDGGNGNLLVGFYLAVR